MFDKVSAGRVCTIYRIAHLISRSLEVIAVTGIILSALCIVHFFLRMTLDMSIGPLVIH